MKERPNIMENNNFRVGFRCIDVYNYFDGAYPLDMIKRYQTAYQKCMRKYRYTNKRYGIETDVKQMFEYFSTTPTYEETEKEIARMNKVNTPRLRAKEMQKHEQ